MRNLVLRLRLCMLGAICFLIVTGAGVAAPQAVPTPRAAPTPTKARQSRPELVLQLGHSDAVTSLAFLRDGQTLVSGAKDGTIKLWNVRQGVLLRTLDGRNNPVSALSVSRDEHHIAATGINGQVQLWNAHSGNLQRVLDTGFGNEEAVSFSPDAKMVAGPSYDKVVLWNASSGKELGRFAAHANGVKMILFAPNGQMATMGENAKNQAEVKLWDVRGLAKHRAPTLRRTLSNFDRFTRALAFSPDGKTLAMGYLKNLPPTGTSSDVTINGKAIGRTEYLIRVLDVASGQTRQTLRGHTFVPYALAFSPNGRQLVSSGMDNTIRLWDLQTQTLVRSMRTGVQMSPVAFSPDGKTIASTNRREDISLWDAQSGELRRVLPGRSTLITGATLSRSGNTLASSGYSAVRLWDMKSGRLKLTREVSGTVSSIHFSRDEKTVLAGVSTFDGVNSDNQLWWVDAANGRLNRWTKVSRLPTIFSPHGTQAVSGPQPFQLWNLTMNPPQPRTLNVKSDSGNRPTALFSPDGKTIAFADRHAAVHLVNAQNGNLIETLQDANNTAVDVYLVAWSPRSDLLATGDAFWDIKKKSLTRLKINRLLWMSQATQMAFSPDGKTLARANSSGVTLWKVPGGALQRDLKALAGASEHLEYSRDGSKLITFSGDGAVHLYRSRDGVLMVTLQILPPTRGQASDNWIAYTPQGFYDASPGAAPFMRWRTRGELQDAARHEKTFHRPDMVQKALAAP